MRPENSVSELLVRWQECRERGQSISAEQLCAGSPELVQELRQRIEALLSMEALVELSARGGETVDDGPGAEPSAAGADSRAAGATVMVPGYEILEELGRGGMGVVYRARQIKANRVVALKMILAGGHAGPAELARFRTEAQALAALRHPHIVQVFEVGEHDGLPFFSLEFCSGGSLDRKLAGTPLPPREAARLVETLARAMHSAHQAGVIHRDLKPANVLLEDGTPRITDFGLAKKLDETAGQTQSGAIMGTPSYMAPEQARGKSKELGPACDIYALGAILYECLTGRPPFKAATALDTILQVIGDEPVPPSQLQSKTPRDLETICLKCLHKDAGKRYASALVLAEDLGRFQRSEPIAARPVGRLARSWRWCRRNPAVASLLAVVLLLLLSGTTLSWLLVRKALEREDDARVAQEKAESLQEKAKFQQQKAEFAGYAFSLREAIMESESERGNRARAWEILRGCDRKFRHWEYDYILRHTRRLRLDVRAHNHRVCCVAYSPDGNRIVSGSGDSMGYDKPAEVKVWDAASGQELLSLKGDTRGIDSVSFSPDGKRIAAGDGPLVKVWDASSGQELRSLNMNRFQVKCVCFSPDGKRIAAGGDFAEGAGPFWKVQGEVQVWDSTTGRELLTLKGHKHGVWSLSFSPDGKLIASGSADETVKVWNASSGLELLSLKGHTDRAWSVAFSPDGKGIASGSGGDRGPGELRLWDAACGQELLTLKGHTMPVRSISFSPDGKRILSSSYEGTVKVWDANTGQEALSLNQLTSNARGVAFSPDGTRIASGHNENGHPEDVRSLKTWDLQPGQAVLTLQGHRHWVRSVSFSRDGKRIASGSYDKTVKVWDAQTGQELLTLKGHTNSVNSVSFSPDSKRILSGSDDGTMKVWDAFGGQELLTLKGDWLGSVCKGSFSPDGKRIASGSSDGRVLVWDATSGKDLLTFKAHKAFVRSVSFSPDGTRIASGSADETVMLWDARSGEEVLSIKNPKKENQVSTLSFSPDGKRIASASGHTVKLWDAVSGEEVLTLMGHTEEVRNVSFSPDGKRIASTSDDHTVKLWEAQTGQEVLSLQEHTPRASCVCFSPDGKRIASGNVDGTLKVWDTEIVRGKAQP